MLNILKTFFIGLINVAAVVAVMVVIVVTVNYFPIWFFSVLAVVAIWGIGYCIREMIGKQL